MPNEENSGATPQSESVKANWAPLESFSNNITLEEEPKAETPEEEQIKDTNSEKPEEIKTEEAKIEEKPETESTDKPEDNKEVVEETKPVIELSVDDIKDAPKVYAEETFQFLAKEMGSEIAEESFDAFKANFVPKAELDKIKEQTTESLFAQLNPEVAAALKLKELGVPDDQILTPTADIDKYLSLSDAELYRAELEAKKIYTEDEIDLLMEKATAEDGKLGLQAGIIRKDLEANKANLLARRDEIINQYTEQKKSADIQRKQAEITQVKEALYNMKEFLGNPISDQVREALFAKFQSGAYDKDFADSKYKAEYIMKKEFGDKIAKHLQNKAFAAGEEKVTKKLSNIPEVKSTAVKRVDTSNQLNDNLSPFAGLQF